jgi:hypothetical protein
VFRRLNIRSCGFSGFLCVGNRVYVEYADEGEAIRFNCGVPAGVRHRYEQSR